MTDSTTPDTLGDALPREMAPPDLAKLQRDIADAEAVAMIAAAGVGDGGSCCNDAVFLNVGSGCAIKRKSKAVEAACGGYYLRTRWWRGYVLSVGSRYGQATRRTVGVEAATAFLKQRGWDVVTFYAVD